MTVSSSAELGALRSGEDLGRLYARLGRQVERRVRAGIRAPDPVIEDACQFAWAHLIPRRQRVRPEKTLSWLATTATHEALALLRRDQRELSWEQELEGKADAAASAAPGPEELVVQRERLAATGGVCARQRRLLWLHALGFSYTEIARLEGCSHRTVERQLLRAKRAVRASATAPVRASATAPVRASATAPVRACATAPARACGACAQPG